MFNSQYTVIQNILLICYQELGITNLEMLFLIHLLSASQAGNHFPSIKQLSQRMDLSEADLYTCLQSLMDKSILRIDHYRDDSGKQVERYAFDLLELRVQNWQDQQDKQNQDEKLVQETDLFSQISQEFGRGLSPMEYQQISQWLVEDKFSSQLILEAVKEASFNNVHNLKYIGKILYNWQKDGRVTSQASQDQALRQANQASSGQVPLINWLDQ
ncbi:hypothetical protein AWM75_06865 [Aerococcus urinaehominis]|uniref:Uncharacterized protein n=1 Tax=Aerococcus urinaehominis TaxID=128944 RepID=A0A0X8FLV9_9LACT|nr:DnaD domain protein [Aerococcus urinaehominis]AMB99722.1 hypothetical protein AWM75_06865 [Aerococcus urinaehominis]SDL91925.1 DNA replication protein [Aerococcus urinaehominis]